MDFLFHNNHRFAFPCLHWKCLAVATPSSEIFIIFIKYIVNSFVIIAWHCPFNLASPPPNKLAPPPIQLTNLSCSCFLLKSVTKRLLVNILFASLFLSLPFLFSFILLSILLFPGFNGISSTWVLQAVLAGYTSEEHARVPQKVQPSWAGAIGGAGNPCVSEWTVSPRWPFVWIWNLRASLFRRKNKKFFGLLNNDVGVKFYIDFSGFLIRHIT